MARQPMSDSEKQELRKEVWDALFKTGGDRDAAAELVGKSTRTLNRYIRDLGLYDALDQSGLMRGHGPPRGPVRRSRRAEIVIAHIRKNAGRMNIAELSVEMYGKDTQQSRTSVYVALNDLKANGVIAMDGIRWFVV